MERIASFSVDHNKLEPGMYISRVDGDIVTYDLRFVRPNTDGLLTNGQMHSVEHLMATFLRNGELRDNVIYFGPMGCQTGFYLLMKNTPDEDVIACVKRVIRDILAFDGEMPGKSAVECGNYRNLSVEDAKAVLMPYAKVLEEVSDKGDLLYR